MACTRRTKSLVSTCVILSGMTNILCLLYVGWITNYVSNKGNIKVAGRTHEKKFDDNRGETLRIIERLDRLESVVNQHIQEKPLKDGDDTADQSLSDSLFAHWGHDLGPESRKAALKKFQYYGYNGYLSDRLSLDRAIPDLRPDGCRNISYPSNLPQVSIIFIFVNEALSVILRSVHSVIHWTPSHLLKEIILVDDNSNNAELSENLQRFVDETNQQRPDFIKVVRHDRQEGLIRSRVSGWRAATAPVVALFDAHVEFSVKSIDFVSNVSFVTCLLVVNLGKVWLCGGSVEVMPCSRIAHIERAHKPYTEDLANHVRRNALRVAEVWMDEFKSHVYMAWNVPQQVWLCGGSVEVMPCSRIAHIERAHKPYTEDLANHVRRNALRVAEVWMDEFKSHVYMAWNVPQQDSGIDIGDIRERKALRERLRCKPFSWFLKNIYSEMRTYTETIAYGVLRNSLRPDLCVDQGPDSDNVPILYICHGLTPQNVYYTSSQQLHIGGLSPTIDDDDNKCLVDVNGRPRLLECSYASSKHMKLSWLFTQGGSIENRKSKRCLELVETAEVDHGYQLALQQCSSQKWTITNILPGKVL
ncbi:polypeptide N-acetylgalactosaminyltransferase 18-like [Sinocyclocheilus anshuiensis]|uniref:polypeptide N-acetylgalactosaminyltransferase 18-like n=1 Tax=Sinocyclocheilus anshuiensis TaxID=1608454 RepID=UPI0007BAB3B7|nr:PREDICTED: polypeptide N-acetylgalactosaminyltransferase 18-like [Sinocyclocheilus anshuiensis]